MENQRITIEVIETKEFRVAAKGYDQHEVDEFLDSICDEMERLEGVITNLKSQLEMASAQARKAEAESGYVKAAAPVAAPAGADNSFREILEMAQRVKDQTIEDAKVKAEEILATAKAEASARLGSLAEEKDELENTVASLKTAAKEYKEKFAALLALSQEALDAAADL